MYSAKGYLEPYIRLWNSNIKKNTKKVHHSVIKVKLRPEKVLVRATLFQSAT